MSPRTAEQPFEVALMSSGMAEQPFEVACVARCLPNSGLGVVPNRENLNQNMI